MEQIFGGIQRGLGSSLNAIYELVGSYGIAIVLLTVVVRALLVPLTLKQTRSMKMMQELQPQIKKIQQGYKAKQQKASDRAELQQIRLEMNRELQGLYREKGVNPLGGCLPLIAQMPVFLAMFSIMRAVIIVTPAVATMVGGVMIPADAFAGKDLRNTVCRPIDAAQQPIVPSPEGDDPSLIRCFFPDKSDPMDFEVSEFRGREGQTIGASFIASCHPKEDGDTWSFECRSALGTGHVPVNGELFAELGKDGADIVGMHPGCSASGSGSDAGIRSCTATKDTSGATESFPYYILVGLIVLTSYYQTKQMQSRNPAQVTDQQRMMTRIMPVFFGFISLNLPAGANFYYLASNVWTVGQQYLMFRDQHKAAAAAAVTKHPPKGADKAERAPKGQTPKADRPSAKKPQQGSKKRKKRR